MSDRVQGMIEKLKYLNRKILEIDKKQSLLVEKEELLEKNLEQRVEKVIVSVDQMKQFTEQCADRLFEQFSERAVLGKVNDYVNLEYFKVPSDKSPKVLLVGFYGAVNLGDELMLQKLYRDLNVIKNDIYVMMCDNENLDAFRYPGMNIIHYPKTKFDFNHLADIFDSVIFGGGAILDDSGYLQEESFKYDLGKIFIELALSFIEKNKEVHAIGLSTNEKIVNEEYQEKLKRIIDGSVNFSVRDKYSKRLIESACGHEITMINDIVLTNEYPKVMKEKGEKYKIGIIWICQADLLGSLEKLVEHIQSTYDIEKTEIHFIPFYNYHDCDYKFYNEFCEKKSEFNFSIESMAYSFENICQKVRECDVVISMRYHGALLGLMNGCRTFSLLYTQHPHYYNKMMDLYEKFECVQDLFFSVEELVEALPVKNDVVINSVDFDNTSYTQIVQSIIKKQKERKEKMDF